jgi:protein TonB
MKTIFLQAILLSLFAFNVKAQIPDELYNLLEDKDTTNLYFDLDQNPEPPGGREKLIKFYRNNLHYPTSARTNGTEGTVYVMFIVEVEGKLRNIKATNFVSKDIDKSAVRLVKKIPKWNPGLRDGKAVRGLFVLPVTYRLT